MDLGEVCEALLSDDPMVFQEACNSMKEFENDDMSIQKLIEIICTADISETHWVNLNNLMISMLDHICQTPREDESEENIRIVDLTKYIFHMITSQKINHQKDVIGYLVKILCKNSDLQYIDCCVKWSFGAISEEKPVEVINTALRLLNAVLIIHNNVGFEIDNAQFIDFIQNIFKIEDEGIQALALRIIRRNYSQLQIALIHNSSIIKIVCKIIQASATEQKPSYFIFKAALRLLDICDKSRQNFRPESELDRMRSISFFGLVNHSINQNVESLFLSEIINDEEEIILAGMILRRENFMFSKPVEVIERLIEMARIEIEEGFEDAVDFVNENYTAKADGTIRQISLLMFKMLSEKYPLDALAIPKCEPSAALLSVLCGYLLSDEYFHEPLLEVIKQYLDGESILEALILSNSFYPIIPEEELHSIIDASINSDNELVFCLSIDLISKINPIEGLEILLCFRDPQKCHSESLFNIIHKYQYFNPELLKQLMYHYVIEDGETIERENVFDDESYIYNALGQLATINHIEQELYTYTLPRIDNPNAKPLLLSLLGSPQTESIIYECENADAKMFSCCIYETLGRRTPQLDNVVCSILAKNIESKRAFWYTVRISAILIQLRRADQDCAREFILAISNAKSGQALGPALAIFVASCCLSDIVLEMDISGLLTMCLACFALSASDKKLIELALESLGIEVSEAVGEAPPYEDKLDELQYWDAQYMEYPIVDI